MSSDDFVGSLHAPQAPKQRDRENPGGDPECHADDAVKAHGAAVDGAGERAMDAPLRKTTRGLFEHAVSQNPTRPTGSRPYQRLEAGDDVEQLSVDAALAQAMEGSVEAVQQIVDVLSARSIAAKRLAFSLARDSAHARKSEMNR